MAEPPPAPLDAALALLRCPHCAAALVRDGAVVRCARGHTFDVARQGYLSLLAGTARVASGDTAAMVAAREAFLAGGAFDPLRDAVLAAVGRVASRGAGAGTGAIVDLGAGTGWYLAAALERLPERLGLALDVSKPALRRAARAHPRIAAVGADTWSALPLREECAAAVLGVFAPRNGPETARVLRPGGGLVVAAPTARHLQELVTPLGLVAVDKRKDERLAAQLEGPLRLEQRDEHEWAMRLDRDAVAALAGMGPSAFHTDERARSSRIAGLPEPVGVTASVTVSVYARLNGRGPGRAGVQTRSAGMDDHTWPPSAAGGRARDATALRADDGAEAADRVSEAVCHPLDRARHRSGGRDGLGDDLRARLLTGVGATWPAALVVC